MIVCQNLDKGYGGKPALINFSYRFEPGHIYAILGPNGSGKSTLMKMIAGLVKPSAGQVLVDDHPLTYKDKATIAYMPTEPYFFSYMTGLQAAKYYEDFFTDFSMERFQWMTERMQLNPAMKLNTYSTGMMAKFKVALNVARNPKMMMLDEPLNGIDMIAREEVTAGIMNGISRDAVILISSHLIEDLERIADHVLFIREGRLVVSGSTAGFREKYGKSMTDMYREIFGAAILYGAPMPGQPYVMPGQAYMVPGQPYMVPGQAYVVPGQPYMVPGQPYAVPGQPYAVPGQPYVVPGQSYAVPGQPYVTPAPSDGIPGQTPSQPYAAPGPAEGASSQPYAAPGPAQGTSSQPYAAPGPAGGAPSQPYAAPGPARGGQPQPYVVPAAPVRPYIPPAPDPMYSDPIEPVQNPYRPRGATETPEDFDNPLA